MNRSILLVIFFITLLIPFRVTATEIHVAVASNFAHTLDQLQPQFEQAFPHRLKISLGSTGKFYAQIRNGAPFDAFLAADAKRPQLLEQEGVALRGSRFTYAVGQIALWSPGQNRPAPSLLTEQNFHYLAIANPKTAPYGEAAQAVLKRLKLWDTLRPKMARGENIAQTFHFIASGNAELGFVALSQIQFLQFSKTPSLQQALPSSQTKSPFPSDVWVVPPEWYPPILQQAVILSSSPHPEVVQTFFDFLKSDIAKSILHDYGYRTP